MKEIKILINNDSHSEEEMAALVKILLTEHGLKVGVADKKASSLCGIRQALNSKDCLILV